MIDSRKMAMIAAEAADDKKAREIVMIDLKGVSLVADYFLVCHGTSDTQVKAIAQTVVDELEAGGFEVLSREGYRDGQWILLDFGGVVVHVFQEEARKYFDLERLWGDAPQLSYPFDEVIVSKKE